MLSITKQLSYYETSGLQSTRENSYKIRTDANPTHCTPAPLAGGDDSGAACGPVAYLPALIAVSKNRLKANPKAKWAAQFHPFVTDSIDKVTYRQFNYALMMSHEGHLTRWLHKYLALKYTFADYTKPFRIHYTTIKRDSGLLNEYSRERAAIDAVRKAFDDLQEKGCVVSL